MLNKNDLRYIKTEKLLQETYFALKLKSKAPIKVSELCNTALINKTTFYDHYQYIELLHRVVCQNKVNELFDKFNHTKALFSDTYAFVNSLIEIATTKTVSILFADDNSYLLELIENKVLSIYLKADNVDEWKMRVRFAIGGALRILTYDTKYNIEVAVKLIQEILPADQVDR